jgi:hypothetical protein
MTEVEAEVFVGRFQTAWAERKAQAFLDLWHPDGELHSPFYDRVVRGTEVGALNDLLIRALPHLTWALQGWTWRQGVVLVEWQNSNLYGNRVLTWRGVDRFTLRGGRIVKEIVCADTSVLHGLRAGKAFEPLIRVPL